MTNVENIRPATLSNYDQARAFCIVHGSVEVRLREVNTYDGPPSTAYLRGVRLPLVGGYRIAWRLGGRPLPSIAARLLLDGCEVVDDV